MGYLLRAFGHQTLEARNGAQGLELARREELGLILMDVHMPGMDGCEAARRLKCDWILRQIPLVAVTALAMVGDREMVLAAGFDGYIPKPIEPENFLQQVKPYLFGDPPRVSAPALTHSPRPIPSATILAVDESTVNLRLLCSLLEPYGYRVITAHSAEEALRAAGEHLPDLILSDVHRPKSSGYDFMEAVKADPFLRSIPFAFLSSTARLDQYRITGRALGADRFIGRPVDSQALRDEIEACLTIKKER